MEKEKSAVENQLAELARGAALVRALATYDEREEIRGGDSLAEAFLADEPKNSLNDPAIREWLVKNYLPYGVYAYTIARTAYFDHVVAQALRDNIPQIVILGAGYDSRPYRFAALFNETRIFELDGGLIQERKRKLLQQAEIALPVNLLYATLSYDPLLLGENLAGAGYDREKQTLFVWEGATYYLTFDEVDKTIRFIAANSPSGSTLCFDYNTISKDKSDSGIGKELAETMNAGAAEDSVLFAIDEWKTGVFLAERDFMIIEHLTSEEMEKRYLTLHDGSSAAKVPARHRIVYASLSK